MRSLSQVRRIKEEPFHLLRTTASEYWSCPIPYRVETVLQVGHVFFGRLWNDDASKVDSMRFGCDGSRYGQCGRCRDRTLHCGSLSSRHCCEWHPPSGGWPKQCRS